jgi:Holliday junction resolvase
MENKVKIKLNEEQISLLGSFPEQGMGYQIVDIKLKNGKILKERIVFNSTYLQLQTNEQINANDIDNLQIH